MSGYIGAVPVPQATETRDVFTATSNQTTFTTQGYTPNFVSVYLNGVHLARADFTATNGSDVVLASGATADDVVEIVSFGTFEVAGALQTSNNLSDLGSASTALTNLGVTSTAAEINLIDGGTARGTTAIADGDGVLVNDAGTMRMTSVETMATYMGTKITGGSLVYLASSGALSNAANVSFTQFDATKYDHYEFWFQNVIPVTDNVDLYLRTSTDGGSSYASSNGDYHFYGTTDKTAMVVTNGVGSATNEYGVSGFFSLFAPHLTAYTYGDSTNIASTDASQGRVYTTPANAGVGNVRLAAEDVDAVQILFSSGNIESGEIVMYGIANGT